MASVKRCDICGSVYDVAYDQEPNGFRFVSTGITGTVYQTHPVLDCCPRCINLLQSFVKNKRSRLVNHWMLQKVQDARDILTAHPFVDEHPASAIADAIKSLDEVLDS